jgi:endonuclease/exonuclease/phosphatase (EEP) superfamily protein YafD
MTRAVAVAAAVLLAGTCLLSLAAWLAPLHWRLDLLTHFRGQYALALTAALALAAAARRRRLAVIAALALALELAQVAPLWLAAPDRPAAPALRVVHFNVLTHNPDKPAATAWLSGQGADLVLAQEVDAAWSDALAAAPGYVPAALHPRADNFGMAWLIRQDLEDMLVRTWQEDLVAGVPALALELDVAGRRLAVLGVHTLPPVSADYAARRDAQLAAVADWTAEQRRHGRVPVVVGDLNASPFSAPLRRLLEGADLVDSQRGFGLQPSWPTSLPWPRIAIDHLLHDRALTTTARALGPHLGSDHLPIVVDLAWSE